MFNVINLKNRLVLLFIVILGFIPSPYAIDTGVFALNLDRILLGLISAASIIFFINKKIPTISTLHLILISFLCFSILNNLILGELQLMSLYTIILLIVMTSNHISNHTIKKGLVLSFIGYSAWAVFGLVYFYTNGPLIQLPLADFLPNFFIKDLGHAEEMANYYNFFPRISFPFGTPPVLSALGAMFFLFFLQELSYQIKFKQQKSSLLTLGLMMSLFIIVVTVSKTGLAIILAGLAINFFLSLSWQVNKRLIIVGALGLLLFSYLIIVASSNLDGNPIAQFIFQRLFENSEDFDPNYKGGHLNIRLTGTEHFLELSLFNKFFGIGYLNIDDLHYHSTLLTALVETGILGFLFLAYILLLPILNASKELFNPKSSSSLHKAKYVISSASCIIVAHLVYEIPYAQFLWVFWAYLLKESTFSNQHAT